MATRGQAAFVQSALVSRKQGFLSYPLPSRYRYIRVSRTSGFPERRTNLREGPFQKLSNKSPQLEGPEPHGLRPLRLRRREVLTSRLALHHIVADLQILPS